KNHKDPSRPGYKSIWHWLIKHPVEFSKNKHTPTSEPPSGTPIGALFISPGTARHSDYVTRPLPPCQPGIHRIITLYTTEPPRTHTAVTHHAHSRDLAGRPLPRPFPCRRQTIPGRSRVSKSACWQALERTTRWSRPRSTLFEPRPFPARSAVADRSAATRPGGYVTLHRPTAFPARRSARKAHQPGNRTSPGTTAAGYNLRRACGIPRPPERRRARGRARHSLRVRDSGPRRARKDVTPSPRRAFHAARRTSAAPRPRRTSACPAGAPGTDRAAARRARPSRRRR
ncbi:hypothetical protein SAMN05444365_1229, partial [Micromonospora pattaloongensis]